MCFGGGGDKGGGGNVGVGPKTTDDTASTMARPRGGTNPSTLPPSSTGGLLDETKQRQPSILGG